MNKSKVVDVFYNGIKVGTMAETTDRVYAFQYDKEWLNNGFSISPISMPLCDKVFVPNYMPFDGIFGVFNDSLPDGWGRLLMDRFIVSKRYDIGRITPLNRLLLVGKNCIGGLNYEPNYIENCVYEGINYDEIERECRVIYDAKDGDTLGDIDEIFAAGGSSGGARPKIYAVIDNEQWIVKFPTSYDSYDIGRQEYEYSLCAKKCGIEMSETRLLNSSKCDGYFATKRFDRDGAYRKHMISVSGMLETPFRVPNLDYNVLHKLVLKITDDYSQMEKMFRLMCFNVFAHNRDDHSKNFAFLYDENTKGYILSPAYDLTYSNSIGGEHATMVNGNGKNPDVKDLLAVAENVNINKANAMIIIEEIREHVHSYLKEWINK